MDLNWERSIPIRNIGLEEIKTVFSEYDKSITVAAFTAIQLGCKNSNYIVNTNQGKFLLRLTDAAHFNNEVIASELVKGRIHVPTLLFHATREETKTFVYQYIRGTSLQKHIVKNNSCDSFLLEQVARACAVIHNTPIEKAGLAEWELPPYELWYDLFLDHPTVRAKIGEERRERIQRLVRDKHAFIPEIDSFQSFIHCDFRPANMLVDEHNQVYVVDWEMASTGHSLGDIGQFFRYRAYFKATHVKLFEQVYHSFANRALPGNWCELSLFRDLVNPLQLLSSDQEAPLRNADLVHIIESTLAYWGY